jgi:signal transduction histidine kinase
MSDRSVCPRCGYSGPPDARYCAGCGLALTPTRAKAGAGRRLDHLPSYLPYPAALLASIPVGLLVRHILINSGLHFPLSFFSLALIAGVGGAWVGWQWGEQPSVRRRLVRILLAAAAIGILLAAVRIADLSATDWLVDQGRRIASDIPGVHVEAVQGSRNIRVVDAPPYELITIAYLLLAGAAGSLAGRLYAALRTREREVDGLRENLLAQAQAAAAQQERNRLARELHDSIKQQIFSIGMSAAAAEARWESDPRGARAALGDLRGVAHEAMVEMNALLQQLAPAPLEKAGLVQALRDQCEALGYRTGALVTAEFGDLPSADRLPAGAQESIFRIVQEAFSNAARHARAGRVSLSLATDGDGNAVELVIADDGRGFDPGAAKEGMGLDNIRQRVRSLDGGVAIESGRGRGTRLRATIPLMKASTRRDAAAAQDHTLNKVYLAGLAGGLVLIAVLLYPLYVLLPGGYVAGWMAGSHLLGLALEIIAAAAAVATGFLAARWAGSGNRQAGALFGALAGGTAGIVLYLGIGAAAAGQAGGGAIMSGGWTSAAGGNELAGLTAGAAAGIIRWSYGVFWAALLAGAGLGSVGGMLAPAADKPSRLSLPSAAKMILIPGVWINALLLIFNVTILSTFERTLQYAAAADVAAPEAVLAEQGALLWPIGTAAVLHLASLTALYFLSRGDAVSGDRDTLDATQAASVIFGLLSFGMASYLLIASPALAISLPSPLGIIILAAAVAGLILGGGYLALFVQASQRKRSLGSAGYPPLRQIVAAGGALWSLALIFWGLNHPHSWGVALGLIVAAVDAVLLAVLYRRTGISSAADAAALTRLRLAASRMLGTGMGSALVMAASLAPTVGSWTSLYTIAVRVSRVLANGPSGLSMADLVRDAYLIQARLAVIVVAGGVAAAGLLILAIGGIMAFMRHRITGHD